MTPQQLQMMVDRHNRFLIGHPSGKRMVLDGLDWSTIDLSCVKGFKLDKAICRHCKITGFEFKAKLPADFSGSTFERCVFNDCHFGGADITNCKFIDCVGFGIRQIKAEQIITCSIGSFVKDLLTSGKFLGLNYTETYLVYVIEGQHYSIIEKFVDNGQWELAEVTFKQVIKQRMDDFSKQLKAP